jgi:hypothetical protein
MLEGRHFENVSKVYENRYRTLRHSQKFDSRFDQPPASGPSRPLVSSRRSCFLDPVAVLHINRSSRTREQGARVANLPGLLQVLPKEIENRRQVPK